MGIKTIHTVTAEESIATTTMAGTVFAPSSPDHASANSMLAIRKQQLARLQSLQRQEQQVLQQMSGMNASSPVSTMALNNCGYADGRDDAPSVSCLRSDQSLPTAGSRVSFDAYPLPAGPRPTTFECDYDTNPTELYLAVQLKDWEAAVERAAAVSKEASTWVSRKEADGKLRWRLLPLHGAIIFGAPVRVISALLVAFSQGAACMDDQGLLPLHLAFRNGCDENVFKLLLAAYPQSIDVRDRKGRTPLVLAKQSTHANRDTYIRALENGPAYYATANAANDGDALSIAPSMPDATQSYQMPTMMDSTSPTTVWSMWTNVAAPTTSTETGTDRINALEAELAKTQETSRIVQETSQVLIEQVNALEALLASRSDTERFLIANLDKELRGSSAALEEAKSEIQTKNLELSNKDEEVAEQAKKAKEAAASYERKCESLMTENNKLQSHVNELERKLGTVATALDGMAAEQELIIEAASKHKETMAACAHFYQTIIADRTRQENLLEDVCKERAQIVGILMRQVDDAERTMSKRERVLEAVKAHEVDIARAAEERDAFIKSVSKQWDVHVKMAAVISGKPSSEDGNESSEEEEESEEEEASDEEKASGEEKASEEETAAVDDTKENEELDSTDINRRTSWSLLKKMKTLMSRPRGGI